jgi:hypothetical protein
MHCQCPKDCCSEVARLREDNAALRKSAETFGALAERLNIELQRERNAAWAARASASLLPFPRLALICRDAVASVIRGVLGRRHAVSTSGVRR